jgi:DNA-binding protein H-NS
MPRKATTNLTAMSVNDLLEVRSQIDRRLAQLRGSLEKQLSWLTTITSSRGVARLNVPGRRGSMKGIKVKPKYRGPKGETWAGRGLRPGWLVALIKGGHKLEEYAIGKQVASQKKSLTKKSRRKRK